MRKIQFVYFDLGRVIVDNEASLAKLASFLSKKSEVVAKFFEAHWEAACRGKISSIDYLRLMERELGFKTDAVDFADFWSRFHVSIQETCTLAKELSQKIKIGVISNAESGVFKKCIERRTLPFIPWSAVVISADIGYIKPELEIYEYAQKKAGVAPEHILYIDDKEENITVAKSLGWEGVVFDKNSIEKSIKRIRRLLNY